MNAHTPRTTVGRKSILIGITTLEMALLMSLLHIQTVAAGTTNTFSDAWGTTEVSASSWMGGAGVDIYSNGPLAPDGPTPNTDEYVNNVNGTSTKSGIEWQCVELVNRLYITNGWITARWPGNGDEMYGNAPSTLTTEANGSITYANAGDVIGISKSGTVGHVAIISSVSGTSWTIASQNTNSVYDSSFGVNNYTNGTISLTGWAGYVMQGLVHHPSSSSSTTSNVPVTSQVDSSGVVHVITGNTDGNVYDTVFAGGLPSPITSAINTHGNLGDKVVSISSQYIGGVIHVYAATKSGSVDDIYYGGGVTANQRQIYSNDIDGDRVGSVITTGSVQHVLTGTSAGNLYDITFTGTGTPSSPWQVGTTLGGAANSVSAVFDSYGVVHAILANNAGGIDDVYWGGGVTLGQRAAWNNSTSGDTATSLISAGNVIHLLIGTTSQSIVDASFTGNTTPSSWSVSAWTPGTTLGGAIDNVSAQLDGSVVHVYAGNNQGASDDVYFGSGTSQRSVWNFTSAVNNTVSSQITSGGVQHVFTVIPQGYVYDTTWTGTTGSPVSWRIR